jgi:hypothetical protein
MSDDGYEIDRRFQILGASALGEMVTACGFAGGILLAISREGRMYVIASLPTGDESLPATMLRSALERVESGLLKSDPVQRGPAANG